MLRLRTDVPQLKYTVYLLLSVFSHSSRRWMGFRNAKFIFVFTSGLDEKVQRPCPVVVLSPIIDEPHFYTLRNDFVVFMAYVNLSESILISSMRAT
jgi:hypothetical protein